MKWLHAASAGALAAFAGGITKERPVFPLWVSLTGSGSFTPCARRQRVKSTMSWSYEPAADERRRRTRAGGGRASRGGWPPCARTGSTSRPPPARRGHRSARARRRPTGAVLDVAIVSALPTSMGGRWGPAGAQCYASRHHRAVTPAARRPGAGSGGSGPAHDPSGWPRCDLAVIGLGAGWSGEGARRGGPSRAGRRHRRGPARSRVRGRRRLRRSHRHREGAALRLRRGRPRPRPSPRARRRRLRRAGGLAAERAHPHADGGDHGRRSCRTGSISAPTTT